MLTFPGMCGYLQNDSEQSSATPFHVTCHFLFSLKILENLWFSDVSVGIETEPWHEMC